MRLTKRQLKRVIREEYSKLRRKGLISEMAPMMDLGLEMGMMKSPSAGKADACCAMQKGDLFDMCAQICDANPAMAGACAQLCSCACEGNSQGCCSALDKICECPICAGICTECCGC